MATPVTSKMEYRYLGDSGLRVSVLSFGNWVDNDNPELTLESVKVCLENGVNFFDTAEIYGRGVAETNLGNALKALKVPREKVVVTTKIFKISNDPNDTFLSRKHVIEGLKNSLKRLQLDYVDVVYCHRYDMRTPLEETCRTMHHLIEQGLAFYWGTSEWTAAQIMEAYKVCDQFGLVKPIVEQCQYNMLVREKVDTQYRDLFQKHKMGTSIWSPLCGGALTGKYMHEIPKDSRIGRNSDFSLDGSVYGKDKKNWDEKLGKLKDIAEKKLNCNLAQLALAWVIANPDVSTCILGGSKASQFEENMKALDVYKKMDKDLLLDIETILGNAPEGEMDFRDWKQLPNRRNIVLGVDYKK